MNTSPIEMSLTVPETSTDYHPFPMMLCCRIANKHAHSDYQSFDSPHKMLNSHAWYGIKLETTDFRGDWFGAFVGNQIDCILSHARSVGLYCSEWINSHLADSEQHERTITERVSEVVWLCNNKTVDTRLPSVSVANQRTSVASSAWLCKCYPCLHSMSQTNQRSTRTTELRGMIRWA